jgi:transcriptional regulator with XRE-family HTH domain
VFEIEFADNFRTLRLQRGLSQAELAELVGIKQATIWGYESGECKPKFDVATKLAKIFDVTVETLYSGQTE